MRGVSLRSKHIVAGIVLTFISSFGQNFFVAIFGGEIRRDFDLSNGEFGTLYMALTIASATVLVILGRVVDQYPASLIGAATVLMLSGAALLLAESRQLPSAIAALFCLRLFGQGMAPHLSVTATTRWFDERSRGKALGLTAIGNPIGEATLPIAAIIAMTWLGWRDVWFAIALALAFVALPVLLYLVKGTQPVHSDHETGTSATELAPHWKVSEVLRHPLFYLLLPGLLAPVFINTAVFFHQVVLSEAKAWNPAWFVACYPFSSVATVSSTLAAGWLIDRFGWLRVLPFVLMPQLLALAMLTVTDAPFGIPAYLAFAGTTMGAIVPLQGAVLAQLYGTRHFGSIRAVVAGFNVLLGALGPAIVGWLIDIEVSFATLFVGMEIYVVACIALFFLARPLAWRYLPRQQAENQLTPAPRQANS